MSVSPRFIADDLCKIVPGLDSDDVMHAFMNKDASKIGELVQAVEREIRARATTLPFGEGHENGLDQPRRTLGISLRYIGEVGSNVESGESDYSTDELGWHAFGAAVGVIGGLLDHLQQQGYNP